MFFFNRALTQLVQLLQLLRALPPGSRWTAAMLAVVVLLSAGYMAMHQGSSPEVDLMHGVPLAAGQLPVMEAALAKANLRGYEIRGTSIFVPRGQEAAYMTALVDAKVLPPNPGAAQRDAINGGTPFEFGPQRDQRMIFAKQQELANSICQMPGIESALVLYDSDNKPGGFRDKVITATVTVKPVGANRLDDALVSSIRNMVARAFAGMKPEDVAVTDLAAGRTWCGNTAAGPGGSDNLCLSLKRTCEQDLKAKIFSALRFIPGLTVEVSVTLDRERFANVARDPHSTTDNRRGGSLTVSHSKEPPPGNSGAAGQQPNTAAILGSLFGGNRGNDDRPESHPADVGVHEQIEKDIAWPTSIAARVSIGVPTSYFKKVWQERNPVEPGQPPKLPDQAALAQIRAEECAKIQRHVAQLLPAADGQAKSLEQVAVTDIPVSEPSPPTLGAEVFDWARQSWQTVGAIGLGLIGLLALRLMARGERTASEPAEAAESSATDQPESKQAAEIPPPHARRFHSTGPSLHDELSEMVERDPDAAANVLRSWIGQVS
jgi:flagellar M-ring protein FliF